MRSNLVGDNSLVNLGDISKPATALIEKVSDAVGGICKPWQAVRVAKAERKAGLIRAGGEIEITELHQRAAQRWLEEEAKKQENIESITALAIKYLDEDADPSQVSDDWVANFFDKSRIVSETEMQELWGKLLAGEANAPGSFSRKATNTLADMDAGDAIQFLTLCRYGWRVDSTRLLVYDYRNSVYRDNRINFECLANLESYGLIRFDPIEGFSYHTNHKELKLEYDGRTIDVVLPVRNDKHHMFLGFVVFTSVGEQLSKLCDASPVDGFYDYIQDLFMEKGLLRTKSGE